MASNHQRIFVSGWLARAGPADMLAADEHHLIPGGSWNVTLQLCQHGVRLSTDQQNVFHVGAPGVDSLSWRVRLSLCLHLLLVIFGLARSVVRCFFVLKGMGIWVSDRDSEKFCFAGRLLLAVWCEVRVLATVQLVVLIGEFQGKPNIGVHGSQVISCVLWIDFWQLLPLVGSVAPTCM